MAGNNSIRFPRINIATSTVNRILNVADGIPSPVPSVVVPPALPDVALQGAQLDAQLQTPSATTELPAGTDGAVVGAALTGDSLTDAAILPTLGI